MSDLTKKQKKKFRRLILAFVLLAAAWSVQGLAPFDDRVNFYVSLALFIIAYLSCGINVLIRAGKSLTRGHGLDETFLMSVASIGAFVLGEFPEAVAVMFFYGVGEFFEDYALNHTRKSVAEMMDIAPNVAFVARDGSVLEVDPYDVKVGDVVIVKAGGRVPVDGVIIEGVSALDTSALTGEAAERRVVSGDEVISGCVNKGAAIKILAEKEFEDSTVSRILELVESAAERKSVSEKFITKFARWYTPIVVAAAVILSVVPPLVTGGAWGPWIERSLIFLVCSCPCAIVISVPLSFFIGIGRSSREGILIKGSSYLETLARAETFVFDKTGTLTKGNFSVVEIQAVNKDKHALIAYVAALELLSDHPVARAIVAEMNGVAPKNAEDMREISGKGVSGVVSGHDVVAGTEALLKEQGIKVVATQDPGTIVYVGIDNKFAGSIVVADAIKMESAHALKELRGQGVKNISMLTGDREEVASEISTQLGLDSYYSQLLPDGKVSALEDVLSKTPNPVVFVGDGINDAPVLVRADVGIAMGAMGSDAAIEAADVVLMDDNLEKISRAIHIARKTLYVVRQNIVLALGFKFGVLLLAVFGLANMWLAIFADVGITIICILNAMVGRK